MTKYSTESFYRAQIAQSILATDTVPLTLRVTKVPTKTSGLLTISPNTDNEEIIEYNAVDGTAKTITVSKRGIKWDVSALSVDGTDYNNTNYQRSHTVNDSIRWDINQLHINQFSTNSDDQTFTGHVTFTWIVDLGALGDLNVLGKSNPAPVVASEAARDALYTSPVTGDRVYRSDLSSEQIYDGGLASWQSLAVGYTPQNATDTVKGVVEIATTAESKAGTNTGGTGASVSVLPSDIAANTQSGTFIYTSSSDVSDTYTCNLTPALTAYTTGMKVRVKFTTANTWACTIDINSLGAKSIKLIDWTDPLDWDIAASSINELIYDGTNFVLQSIIMRASSSDATTWTNNTKAMTPSATKDSIKDSIWAPSSVWSTSGSGAKTSWNIQATTSWFVTATCDSSFSNSVLAYVWASNPANILIGQCSRNSWQNVRTSLCFPVKKWYYYRLDWSGGDSGDSYQAYFTPSA